MDKVTVKEASERLGVSQETLRSWLRHKVVPFGVADLKDGNEKWQYTIFRKDFEEYVLSKT